MITGETPLNNVSHSEWTSRLDAMKDKIDWRDELPDLDYSKIYLFNQILIKLPHSEMNLFRIKVLLSISVSNSSRYNAETMAYNTDKFTGIKRND